MNENDNSNNTGGDYESYETTTAAPKVNKGGWTPEQQARIDEIVKSRLTEDRARDDRRAARQAPPTQTPGLDYNALAQAIVAAQQQAAQQPPNQPPPAAAPSASSGPVAPITSGGILDLFQLSHQQLQQLGPTGVRKALDDIRNLHHEQSGLARLPSPPAPHTDPTRKGWNR